MPTHPALQPGRVAVVTGAADGIGLAAARKLHDIGLSVVMADVSDRLDAAASSIGGDRVLARRTDVTRPDEVAALRDAALERFGRVDVLMNNAGIEGGGRFSSPLDLWHRIVDTNFWGAVHGVQAFLPTLEGQGTPALVINTGSKQGITTPPGNAPYNVSKAALKVMTEALAHELRERDAAVTAHLLIPGFVFTGLTRARGATAKPDAAWTPEQTVDFMLTSLERGDFYILCPDNDVARPTDEKRVLWAAGDLVENRPALSRWHPDYKDAFADYMNG